MSAGIVFKQRYEARNKPRTAFSNGRHLEYIATRYGVSYNEGCGFGTWGRLPEMSAAQNLNNLVTTKKTIVAASKEHTVYRNIFSVDDETAKEKDLYSRETWQALVTEKVAVLAAQMGIKAADFCWVAAMHQEKGHPHVHLMCWDSGPPPQPEGRSQQNFEIMAEKVRAAFNGSIFHEELRQLQSEQPKIETTLRTELRAMCSEANVSDALNLHHVSPAQLDEFGTQLKELTLLLPKTGGLKYQNQTPEFKTKIDEFLDKVLTVSDFQKLAKAYTALAGEVSALYGNGVAEQGVQEEHAKKDLYNRLGNIVLGSMRETVAALRAKAPQEAQELRSIVQGSVRALCPTLPQFAALLALCPKHRMPFHELRGDEAFQTAKNELVHTLCGDLRVRAMVQGYISAKLPTAEGAEGEDKAAAEKAFMAQTYRAVSRAVEAAVLAELSSAAGWDAQRQAAAVMNLLMRLFSLGSQSKNQMQSARALRLSRDLSKTAQKDRRKQREQDGAWTFTP